MKAQQVAATAFFASTIKQKTRGRLCEAEGGQRIRSNPGDVCFKTFASVLTYLSIFIGIRIFYYLYRVDVVGSNAQGCAFAHLIL